MFGQVARFLSVSGRLVCFETGLIDVCKMMQFEGKMSVTFHFYFWPFGILLTEIEQDERGTRRKWDEMNTKSRRTHTLPIRLCDIFSFKI